MENSVNALQMAFGLLIGVLLLSLLVFVFNMISSTEDTKQDLEMAQQTTEFNQKFLAFDKTSMYGTDLISILGMAIANNKVCNTSEQANPDGRYNENVDGSINIKFTLTKDIYTRKNIYIYYYNQQAEQNIEDTSQRKTEQNKVLKKNTVYSLVVTNGNTTILETLDKISIEGNSNTSTTTKTVGTKTTVTETDSSGFNDLKQAIFSCEGVEYNGSGKIYCMTFKQKENT